MLQDICWYCSTESSGYTSLLVLVYKTICLPRLRNHLSVQLILKGIPYSQNTYTQMYARPCLRATNTFNKEPTWIFLFKPTKFSKRTGLSFTNSLHRLKRIKVDLNPQKTLGDDFLLQSAKKHIFTCQSALRKVT